MTGVCQPTQANGGLEWGTRHLGKVQGGGMTGVCQPTQANGGLEWGTREAGFCERESRSPFGASP
jgi:hypothetical protein